jgi:hypothetical protein
MKNVGAIDRIIRIILAVVFFAIGSLKVDGTPRLILYFLSLIMVVTATTGFCLLYKPFGINTRKK